MITSGWTAVGLLVALAAMTRSLHVIRPPTYKSCEPSLNRTLFEFNWELASYFRREISVAITLHATYMPDPISIIRPGYYARVDRSVDKKLPSNFICLNIQRESRYSGGRKLLSFDAVMRTKRI